MKIVYSLPHPADRLDSEQAGHIVRANALLDALERRGHHIVRVEAAAGARSSGDDGERLASLSVRLYRRLVRRLLPRPIALWMRDNARVAFSRRYAVRLAEVVRREQPDVILETHVAYSLGGKLASEWTGVPLVLDDVAPSWEEQQLYGSGSQRLAIRIHREVTSHARLVVAVSTTIKRYLIEDGIPEERVVLISNGIDSRLFHPNVDGESIRTAYGIPPDSVVIVFVGSFQPYHRVDLLLHALAQISPFEVPIRVLLVGGDKRSEESKALVTSLGLADQVIFTGRVPYDQVPIHIAAGDIATIPASNIYGNPMKIYEYMALGRAVIAPRQETITELAVHGENAWLFAPDDVAELAHALRTLITDPALRARLGARAAVTAQEHTWDRRAETLEAALQAIC